MSEAFQRRQQMEREAELKKQEEQEQRRQAALKEDEKVVDTGAEKTTTKQKTRKKSKSRPKKPKTDAQGVTESLKYLQKVQRDTAQVETTTAENRKQIQEQQNKQLEKQIEEVKESPSKYQVKDTETGEYRKLVGSDIDAMKADLERGRAYVGQLESYIATGKTNIRIHEANIKQLDKTISRQKNVKKLPPSKAMTDPTVLEPVDPMTGWAYGTKGYGDPDVLTPAKSLELFEKSKEYSKQDTGQFLGIPYSKKGAYQIGAVLTGSIEKATTPITGMIPGKQPFELGASDVSVGWRNIGDVSSGELTGQQLQVARVTGFAAELGVGVGAFMGTSYVAGVGVDLTGAGLAKVPWLGTALTTAGTKATSLLNTPIGKIAITTPVVLSQAKRTYSHIAEGKPGWEIAGETTLDVSKTIAAGVGLSRGISYGKQLPVKLERMLRGGETIPESRFIPEYVRSGEAGFPRFDKEPFDPSAEGYKAMAEAYTPEELRITETGIPSYHATAGPLKGKTQLGFMTRKGVRTGESGMFYAPAGSKHFLRLGAAPSPVKFTESPKSWLMSKLYSMRPGVPNIFGESKFIYGEFPSVQTTGLSKKSVELAGVMKQSQGTGVLFMPSEQLKEAQSVLAPGTEMVKMKGGFFTDIAGKTVRIERYLPKGFFENLPGFTVTARQLAAQQAAASSYIYGKTSTTYLPLGLISPTKPKSRPQPTSKPPRSPVSVSKISGSTVSEYSGLKPLSGISRPSRPKPSSTVTQRRSTGRSPESSGYLKPKTVSYHPKPTDYTPPPSPPRYKPPKYTPPSPPPPPPSYKRKYRPPPPPPPIPDPKPPEYPGPHPPPPRKRRKETAPDITKWSKMKAKEFTVLSGVKDPKKLIKDFLL